MKNVFFLIIIGLVLNPISSAFAKDNWFANADAVYMQNSLSRVDADATRFTLASSGSYSAKLGISWEGSTWAFTLDAIGTHYALVPPSTRTLNDDAQTVFGGSLGISYFFQDIQVYIKVNQDASLLLEDKDTNEHTLNIRPYQSATIGMRLSGKGRLGFYVIGDLSATFPISTPTLDDEDIVYRHNLSGKGYLQIGSSDMHGGFYLGSNMAEYQHVDFIYTLKEVVAGFYFSCPFGGKK